MLVKIVFRGSFGEELRDSKGESKGDSKGFSECKEDGL